ESAAQMPSVYFNVGRISFPAASIGTQNPPQPAAVLNGGEAALMISDIQVSGANAGDFSLIGQTTCLNQAISPGPTPKCSFEVGFTPSMSGPEVAALTITDNAPGSPQVLELTGAGKGPLAAISPQSLDFGNQPENTIGQAQTVTLANAGGLPLNLASFSVAGPDAAQFPVQQGTSPGATNCEANLAIAPGSSCVVKMAFAPGSAGTFHAEIDFLDNSEDVTGAKQVVPLSGVGTASAPITSLSISSMDFGTQQTGTSGGSQTVTLTNVGSAALTLTSTAITGANATEFAIVASGTTCPAGSGTLGFGSNPNASCTVSVDFAPQTGGSKTASLSFTDNAAGSPQRVTLSGSATAAPSLQVSPANLSFGAQSEGIAGASQAVTISNTGSTAAGISGVTVSGTNARDFALADPCAPSLAAGKNCQISVSFSPVASTTPGSRSATLNIPGGNPPTVTFSGTATQAGISLPTSFNFGPQLAGTSGAPQPLTVTNNSSGPLAGALAIASTSKSGTNAGDFVLSADNCTGSSTPPSGTCTMRIAFKPIQSTTCSVNSGARTAMLSLADNAPGSPHSIPFSGTAMDLCIAAAPGQGISSPITAGQSATFMLEVDSSAGFSGSAQLGCSNPPPLGTCTVSTTPATNPPVVQIAPGKPGEFQVVVTSTAPGTAALSDTAERGPPRPPATAHPWWWAMLCAVTTIGWGGWTKRRAPARRRSPAAKLAQACALLLVLGMELSACGGGGAATIAAPAPGTPPGTYTVTVSATVTLTGQPSVERTFPINITIQ
ncbi:MAG TPA: choice-of-anchor D domain-containing protein, partial [Candidatus Acidoferrales bacterium]|nr:choice-of-anchor D domain-containing protein [Candidatus Acidoferrales bacterium]